MNEEAKISIGEQADLAACLGLLRLFYAEEGIDTTPEQMNIPLRSLLDGSQGAVFLADRSGQTIGIAVTALSTGVEQGGLLAELTDLYVLPEFRRQGVGSSLVAFAARWAERNHCRRIQLSVTAKGQATRDLIGFYGKHAFHDTGRTVLSTRDFSQKASVDEGYTPKSE